MPYNVCVQCRNYFLTLILAGNTVFPANIKVKNFNISLILANNAFIAVSKQK